jgi:pyruvate/2-oxoglutarate dehydrogenase complex dihydrolipoamide dehydrogenase (E3) component
MNDSYDLVIIGGGSTGLMAAGFAVQLGACVAIVEKHRLGGECTWTGCVPSKTLLKAAKVAHQMRTADRYGLPPVEPAVDLKSVMAQVRPMCCVLTALTSSWALPASSILAPWPLARLR